MASSTTASLTCMSCQLVFHDCDLMRSHYKSDWHRYNLKRKVADLPPVSTEVFLQKVMAQRELTAKEDKSNMRSTCDLCHKRFQTSNAFANHLSSKRHCDALTQKAKRDTAEVERRARATSAKDITEAEARVEDENLKNATLNEPTLNEPGPSQKPIEMETEDGEEEEVVDEWEGEALGIEECLFCPHVGQSMDDNVGHMTREHSFFIPDLEYIVDLETFISYLGQKVGDGHICLWCNESGRQFKSCRAVQQHMMDKGHCKLAFDPKTCEEEYADFYDYSSSYPDHEVIQGAESLEVVPTDGAVDNDDDDVTQGEYYSRLLPSGVTIGHRSLMRYYQQNLRPNRSNGVGDRSAVSRIMSQYRALGWTGAMGCTVAQQQRQGKDVAFYERMRLKRRMQLGTKANKLQTHFRNQILF